ncbi:MULTISPECIES: hypothetical protein [unclassified Caballeronia]|uniref:hypothetical protein n=1 Tax=unclassified Caballeronia TaxID=2646786 RepID=UPI00202824B8|nr:MULTISPECIES: hypothetical protein [unclassified Caballeronia]
MRMHVLPSANAGLAQSMFMPRRGYSQISKAVSPKQAHQNPRCSEWKLLTQFAGAANQLMTEFAHGLRLTIPPRPPCNAHQPGSRLDPRFGLSNLALVSAPLMGSHFS